MIKLRLYIYFIVLLFVFFPFSSGFEPVKTVIITKDDILNAKPKSPYEVEFSQKDLKIVEILEKRHFPRTYEEFSDKERLKNLEYELFGKIWEYTPKEERIRRLSVASSNRMLTGMALPCSISSKRNAKRMRNDSLPIRQKDDVGLIDGFLRLLNPDKYEQYRRYSEEMFYKYEE